MPGGVRTHSPNLRSGRSQQGAGRYPRLPRRPSRRRCRGLRASPAAPRRV